MSATLVPTNSSNHSSGAASSSGHSKSAASARQAAISAVTNYPAKSPPIEFVDIPAQDYYSTNVFSKTVMKDRLPKSVYKSLIRTIECGRKARSRRRRRCRFGDERLGDGKGRDPLRPRFLSR